jgi:beta-phosphoglucomutase-like phosphatase (HAD superfamily)
VIRALLFDFDGVIVDTEAPTYHSWRDIYAEHGADLPLETYLPAVGTGSSTSSADGGFDAVAHLEGLIGKRLDRKLVIGRRAQRKLELCDAAPLLDGVRERLEDASRLGLKTAIVTRNKDGWVARHCSRVGLEHRWDAIVCANAEPTMDKADLYRRALAQLGVSASEAVAIEDSPAGVAAAKDAGVYCVAVPNDITRSAPFERADLVLDSMAELRLEDLLQSTDTRTA